MPHIFPDVAVPIKDQMPATHKMWWMRGLVMHAEQVHSAEGLATIVPKIITKVQVFEIDSEKGHEMMLMGEGYDLAEGDVVSLFGHEPSDAQNPTTARLILNHNTGSYTRAYPSDLFYPNTWHFGDFKHRLACKTTLTSNQKNTKIAIILGIFVLATIATCGATLIIGGILLMVGIPILLLQHGTSQWATPAFNGQKKQTEATNLWGQFQDYLTTKYQNIMPLYEYMASTMDNWVAQNPDEKKRFVAVPRRGGSRGQLVE